MEDTVGSYAEHLIELATLYFGACQANPDAPDLAPFKQSMEEVPLHNRPFYVSFLKDMQNAVKNTCCTHQHIFEDTEMKREECSDCGYIRYSHQEETGQEGWMETKITRKAYGDWRPKPITKQVGSL